jgi:Na+-translocating ferredoxin:NAD+ oxidoreductase RNF subunit RnfB
MVDVARYFTSFLVEESCGKCTTCREGLRQLCFVLDDITRGKGKEGDLAVLRDLGETVMDASLCALGGTAANPLLSTMNYFPEEYAEHVKDKVCRALSCKDLVRYSVVDDMCTGCQVCEKQCPTKAIAGGRDVVHRVEQDKCIRCGVCFESCKFDAIRVASGPYARTSGGKKGKTVKEKLAAKAAGGGS